MKDNSDDTNYVTDSDEVVTAVSSAVGLDETRTTIEAMIVYTGGDCVYEQQSQCADRSGNTPESGVNTVSDDPVRQSF